MSGSGVVAAVPIGMTLEGAPMRLDLRVLLTTKLLLNGNSGAGKSRLLRVMLERLSPLVQCIVIDPEGEFSTLRERHDFVLAGPDGEVPAHPGNAAQLARKLIELGTSAVIDLYELPMGDRRAFVRIYCEELLNLPKKIYRQVFIPIDEAQMFAPEKGHGEAESLDAVIALLAQGRKRGLCAALATQRFSKLHKDAAAECNNVLIGRTVLDVDQKRAANLLGIDQAARQELKRLKAGTFHVFGPAFDAAGHDGVVLMRADDPRTTHPEPGARQDLKPPAPSKAIAKVATLLAEIPRLAEQERQDVASLQLQVRTLKQDLAAAKRAQPLTSTPKAVEIPILKDRDTRRLAAVAKILERRADQVEQAAGVVRAIQQDLAEKLKPLLLPKPAALAAGLPTPLTTPAARPTYDVERWRRDTTDVAVTGFRAGASLAHTVVEPQRAINAASTPGAGEARVLKAVAMYGDEGATRETITVLTGYKRSSRDAYLQRLGAQGLIERAGDRLVATPAGERALGSDFEPLPTGEALKDYWLARLPEGEGKILRLLLFNRQGLDRDAISENTPYKRSSRDAYLQRMKARRVVVYSGRLVLPAPEFFE